MAYETFTPSTGNFQVGTGNTEVPVVVPQARQKESLTEQESREETQSEKNKRLGIVIQDYLNGDENYKKEHQQEYDNSRNELAELNRFLVVHIARGFAGRGLSLDDLIGEGNLGLIRATEDFNPEYEFSTYASPWIINAIIRGLYGELRAKLPIPYHICSSRRRINDVEFTLKRESGRNPAAEEVAQKFNETFYPNGPKKCHIKDYQVEALRIAEVSPISLKNKRKYKSLAQNTPTPQEILDKKETLEEMRRLLRGDTLDEMEKTVVTLYYGLNGSDAIGNFSEIGRTTGYTRERIRQIHNEALGKLRGKMYPKDEKAA